MEKNSKFCFYCDDKYDEVISVLIGKCWIRVNEDLLSETTLIWRNLKQIEFDNLPVHVVVNHFQGSQHFSNKAYLVYHLASTGRLNHCPTTWSPSYKTVSDLCFLLLQSDLLHVLNSTLSDHRALKTLCSTQLHAIPILRELDYISDRTSLMQYLHSLEKIIIAEDSTFDSNSLLHSLFPERISCENENFNTWIVKPVGLSCGEQIVISRGLHQTLEIANSFGFKCIVQQYIERPLLVRNSRKFDIRQWVLITSLEPLTIYGFSECYLRLTSKEFSLEEVSLSDPLMHLSNHAIQKTGDWDELQLNTNYLCETMMSQIEFENELAERNPTSESFSFTILPQIRQISIDVVESVRDRLSVVGRGFEWLGLDLMVTEEMKVRLLEVNTSPDITHSTPITSRLVKYAVSDLMDLLFNNERSTSPQSTPYWCLWHRNDSSFSALQVTAAKRKKYKLQANCLPPDTEIYEKLSQVLKNAKQTGIQDNYDNEEESEI